jgi:hypothetical protein
MKTTIKTYNTTAFLQYILNSVRQTPKNKTAWGHRHQQRMLSHSINIYIKGSIIRSNPFHFPQNTRATISTNKAHPYKTHVPIRDKKFNNTLDMYAPFPLHHKVKLSLYKPWRPLGLQEVEARTFSDIRLIDGGKVVSPTRRPHFTPRKIPGTHFC